jgi:hypothetical protein
VRKQLSGSICAVSDRTSSGIIPADVSVAEDDLEDPIFRKKSLPTSAPVTIKPKSVGFARPSSTRDSAVLQQRPTARPTPRLANPTLKSTVAPNPIPSTIAPLRKSSAPSSSKPAATKPSSIARIPVTSSRNGASINRPSTKDVDRQQPAIILQSDFDMPVEEFSLDF